VSELVILKTGSTHGELDGAEGDFEDWFVRELGVPRERARVVDVRSEEPPDPSAAWGAVVTGSRAMVTEREAWMERAAAGLRDWIAAGRPVLGVCFGHQLLAHALGGEVDWNPQGRIYGTIQVELLDAGKTDPLFGVLPPRFAAHTAHSQSVRRLPPGAVPLARSEGIAVQAARYADTAWGVQFHPEFSESVMRAYVRKHAPEPDALLADVVSSPAKGLLARFGEWFRAARTGVLAALLAFVAAPAATLLAASPDVPSAGSPLEELSTRFLASGEELGRLVPRLPQDCDVLAIVIFSSKATERGAHLGTLEAMRRARVGDDADLARFAREQVPGLARSLGEMLEGDRGLVEGWLEGESGLAGSEEVRSALSKLAATLESARPVVAALETE